MNHQVRSITSQMVLISALTLNMLAFQNCSEGFKMQQELASQSFDASTLSVPQIALAATAKDIYNTANVTIDFDVTVAGSAQINSIMCQLDTSAAQDCAMKSVSFINLADGDHTLKITAETKAGMKSELSRVFRKDSTAPVVSVSLAPSLVTGSLSAQFLFAATDNLSGVASIECSLDNAAFAVCVSPSNLTVAAGAHNYRIRATDRANNVSLIYSYNWTVDSAAPVLTISAKPNASTNSTAASFSFSSNKVSTYECQLDAAAFAACTSPQAYSALAGGNHTFSVRATDSAGNLSQVVSYTWMIDVTAPTNPNLASSVQALTQLKTASMSYSSTDAGSGVAGFQCSLDNAVFAACTSPTSLTNLAEGNHNFRVKALDNVGNMSGESAFSWRVDSIAPVVTFTSTPQASTTATTAAFAFTASDAGSGLASTQCSLDNGAFANCVSPTNLTGLAVGAHSFRVQTKDLAGLATTISFSWTITAPVVVPVIASFSATPAAITAGQSSMLMWSVTGATTLRIDALDVTGTTSRAVTPAVTTTYTLTATNSAGSVTQTVTVTVSPAAIVWSPPAISFVVGSGSTFDLASTLPSGVIKGGVFSVDASGTALPAGMTLSTAGILSVGSSAVGNTTGVIFSYTEP